MPARTFRPTPSAPARASGRACPTTSGWPRSATGSTSAGPRSRSRSSLENVLRHAGGGIVRRRGRRDARVVAPGRAGRGRGPVHAGPGHPPGLHRRAGRRRPRGRCATRWPTSAATRRRSTRSSRPTSSSTTRVQVDRFGTPAAFAFNVEREYERNGERYQLLRWAQTAFRDLRVVPPGHRHRPPGQPRVPRDGRDRRAGPGGGGGRIAYPDTLVGTDSHTTMINALGVLGYGVGGIEAEAVLLGQPLYQPMPRIVGVRLHGELPRGSTATDLVLVVTEMLRAYGVVGAFVEFAGDGLAGLSLADRATISNMSPEFGATSTIFPIDDETLSYLRLTGRSAERSRSSSATRKEQGLWREPGAGPDFDDALELDLATVDPVRRRPAPAAGPRPARPTSARTSGRTSPTASGRSTRPASRAAGRRRGRRGERGVVPGQRPAVVRDRRPGRGRAPAAPADRRRRRRPSDGRALPARSRSRSAASGRRSGPARSRSPRSPRARTPRTRP